MKFTFRTILFIFLLPALALVPQAQEKNWQAISPTELQMKTPQVEPDADAEVLFWEVRIVDDYFQRSGWQSVLNHHVRIKVFTERGREKNSKVDIPFGNILDPTSKVIIRDIAARTIKPDGTIIDLKPEDIFERDIVKLGGIKVKAKSFAVPGIETGAIIEYRWKEVRTDTFNYTRIELARDIPVQFVKYFIRPANVPIGMRLHSFNTEGGFTKEADGFYSTTMKNVPAVREEPRMPSEYDVKPWVLVYYAEDREKQAPADYWRRIGKNTFDYHKGLLKPNGEIKTATMQAIGDATDPQEKARRIFEFCRKNIKNIQDDAYGLTADQLKEYKPNKNPADAIKRGSGDAHDIDMVFGAMLIAAGIDARVANVAARNDASFNRNLTNDYFIRTEMITAKIGDRWQFFEPSNRNLPFGMIPWRFEGQDALISDSSEPIWEKTPVSLADGSKQKRAAKLRLAADGSLEGSVRIEFTGHLADFYREYNDDDSPAEREKYLAEVIKAQVGSGSEISNILIDNLDEAEKPVVYSFNLRVPAYAERTGKRIFLRPSVFKRNTGALFTAGQRKYDIFFNYAWSEDDDISFELPDGFSPEAADSPRAIKDEKTGAAHETSIKVADDKQTLVFRRNFSFGKSGALLIYDFNYSGIKALFDSFQTADSHSIILRENAPQTN